MELSSFYVLLYQDPQLDLTANTLYGIHRYSTELCDGDMEGNSVQMTVSQYKQ